LSKEELAYETCVYVILGLISDYNNILCTLLYVGVVVVVVVIGRAVMGVVHPLKSHPRYIVNEEKKKQKKNATSGLDKTNNE